MSNRSLQKSQQTPSANTPNHPIEPSAALEEAQALTHLGSWQWDVASDLITWSDELYRIYGLKPQERPISFELFLSMIHPDDQERVSNIIGNAYATTRPFEFEHRIITKNEKKERILYGMGRVITDKSGQVVRMYGTSQDITERKKTQFALQQSDERFKAVTQATRDLVYDLDFQTCAIWFNETLYTDYGYSKKQTNNTLKWWLSRIHPEDASWVQEQIDALRQSDQHTWYAEYRFSRADGSYALVRNRASVLRNASGQPDRVIGSLLDITAQKQLERAKDEFLSLVSHQLRTPLTVTRLYSEMLSQGTAGDLNGDQKDYVNRITQASVRMIRLVGEILNISRIELDRVKVHPVPTDVNALIQSRISDITSIAEKKNVSVKFIPQRRMPKVAIDSNVFNLILENLLTNAIRYTKQNKGKVIVRFKKRRDGFILSVTDNGIGIPVQAQKHIYSRFYRAENAINLDSEGTGLGLYLIKLTCDVVGAQTWFESKKNKGTTFYVQFPPQGMKARKGKLQLE